MNRDQIHGTVHPGYSGMSWYRQVPPTAPGYAGNTVNPNDLFERESRAKFEGKARDARRRRSRIVTVRKARRG